MAQLATLDFASYGIQEKTERGENALADYYRCPPEVVGFSHAGRLDEQAGFFRLGFGTVCYGKLSAGAAAGSASGSLNDALAHAAFTADGVMLPFNPSEVVENLRRERYHAHSNSNGHCFNGMVRKAYYAVRPFLGVAARRHLQRLHLRGWDKISFPAWPVDTTVERIHRKLLALSLRARGLDRVPFVWFWPYGYSSCAIVTHDIETHAGRDFCPRLMDLDESFGIRSSFQVVPEGRYRLPEGFLTEIERRGFEVTVHDLNHDGRLYSDRAMFLKRAQRINSYAREFGAQGFRSAILYRNADWYDAFDFSYDMSLPNVAHLDPQRGGCCTVMPYFIGNIVELPVTMTQDYTLFNILGDYSIGLWKKQMRILRENCGLASVIVHPDYIQEPRAEEVYKALLAQVAEVRDQGDTWMPLPREVAAWWRERGEMEIVREGGHWRVVGPGSERARVAYATLAGDSVRYCLD